MWVGRKRLWLGVFLTKLGDFSTVGASGEATMMLHRGASRQLWVVEVVAEREREDRDGRKWEEREKGEREKRLK